MNEKRKNVAVTVTAALFLLVFCLWGIFSPDAAQSMSERRPLAKFPELSVKTVASGKFMADFETYALDQFPLRDGFRRVKALTAANVMRRGDNNGIYRWQGYTSKLEYPVREKSVEHAADRFRYVYEKYIAETGDSVYLSVIPDKNQFMARESGHPAVDFEQFAGMLQTKMDFAQYIDIYPLLSLEDYYRTDTHWRQEQVVDVARQLGRQMGAEITGDYSVNRADTDFYGVYHGQSALPEEAEELFYLTGEVLDGCRVFDYETGKNIPVYDLSLLRGRDPYEMFLSGSKSLLTIDNPNANSDKQLILFRDSFGSSLAPLLAEGYKKITLVDIRYIAPAMLEKFISFENADVLFLYSLPVLNNSETIK